MVAITTLATGENSLKDLKVFLFTLGLFNKNPPKIYLLCDEYVKANVKGLYRGEIVTDSSLDLYHDKTRASMEKTPGVNYKTLWEDYMMEKASVIDLAFKSGETQVFFFDSDICFMGPLPEIPTTTQLGLSQHMIRQADEERFGKYNAGYLYTTDKNLPDYWREAAKTSRYYDQAALEEVETRYIQSAIYYFPIQNNYGWWRVYQSIKSPQQVVSEWSIFRKEGHSGIKAHGEMLLSIHTHWGEARDMVTLSYNKYIFQLLDKLSKHNEANQLRKFLSTTFPHLR